MLPKKQYNCFYRTIQYKKEKEKNEEPNTVYA